MITGEHKKLVELLQQEVKPALGCTEPIAVALAAAKASEEMQKAGEKFCQIIVEVSPNILKNGMGVGIPGTDMIGVRIAAALGGVCGKSKYQLEVLKDINPQSIAQAQQLVEDGLVSIKLAETDKMLYIRATACNPQHRCRVTIEDTHDNISLVEFDDKPIIDNRTTTTTERDVEYGKSQKDHPLTLKSIYDFATEVDFKYIEFILESGRMNSAIAEEGLKNNYGLRVGKTLYNNRAKNLIGHSVMTYAMALTAAASDARMAGSSLPAMSNSGSGNQGITATMPVVATAQKIGSSEEQLARALIISHLVSIHIKQSLGRLSALCGCVVASSGSACGIVYLLDGGYEQITYAIKNMVGNIAGMICDGAKVGCALKVSSGVSAAVQSATLAMENVSVTGNDGIIDDDIEKTIENLSIIGTKGMVTTDKVMLEIMVNKKGNLPEC